MPRKRWDEIIDRLPEDRSLIGAEIGVWCGGLCHRLLRARPLLSMYLVDWWKEQGPESSYFKSGDTAGGRPQKFFDKCYARTIKATAKYQTRRTIFRMDSVAAADRVQDGCLDFCFVDGDHSFEGVVRDIQAWKSKVKPGGWLCGHDWENDEYKHWGVKKGDSS